MPERAISGALPAAVLQKTLQAGQFTAEEELQNQKFFLSRNFPVIDGLAGEFFIEVRQEPLAPGIHEQTVNKTEKIITGGSVNRPLGDKGFPVLQNFFNHNPGSGRRGPEALQIRRGITQPVRVIDSQSVDPPLAYPVQHPLMGGRKNRFFFHANAGQLMDIEKAAVIQVLVGQPPETKPVMLKIQKPFQAQGVYIDRRDSCIQCRFRRIIQCAWMRIRLIGWLFADVRAAFLKSAGRKHFGKMVQGWACFGPAYGLQQVRQRSR